MQRANPDFMRCFALTDHESVCDTDFDEFVHPSMRQYIRSRLSRLAELQESGFAQQSVALGSGERPLRGELVATVVRNDAQRFAAIVLLVKPETRHNRTCRRSSGPKKLTTIAARILEGIARGEPTVRLASKLHLSRQGIEYHIGAMMRDFRVPNRVALVSKAYSAGMLRLGIWPPAVLPDCVRDESARDSRRSVHRHD